MWHRNNGKEEAEVVQNQWTAYLVKAIKRRRNDYIEQISKGRTEPLPEETSGKTEYSIETYVFTGLPVMMQLENAALFCALKGLTERERCIFLARVLDEKPFEELAEELGLSYKGAAAIYYRTIRKIKEAMKEVGR